MCGRNWPYYSWTGDRTIHIWQNTGGWLRARCSPATWTDQFWCSSWHLSTDFYEIQSWVGYIFKKAWNLDLCSLIFAILIFSTFSWGPGLPTQTNISLLSQSERSRVVRNYYWYLLLMLIKLLLAICDKAVSHSQWRDPINCISNVMKAMVLKAMVTNTISTIITSILTTIMTKIMAIMII